MTQRLALVRRLDNQFLVASEASNLSMVERQLGNLDAAEELAREALVVGAASVTSSRSRSRSAGWPRLRPSAVTVSGRQPCSARRGDDGGPTMEWPPDERPHYERMLASCRWRWARPNSSAFGRPDN